MNVAGGVALLALSAALAAAGVGILVHGIRRNTKGEALPTSTTGPVLAFALLAAIAGLYGFTALFGTALGIGVAINTG